MYVPRKDDLSGRASSHQRDVFNNFILEQQRRCVVIVSRGSVDGVDISERRIRCDVNAIVFVPLHLFCLLKVWMQLKLVYSGLCVGFEDEVFHLCWVEVGDANVTDFAGIQKLLYCVPCLLKSR